MDDEDGPQGDVANGTGGLRRALWRKPLCEWWAAAAYLVQAAIELSAQTASLLFAAAVIAWQALTWRDERKVAR